MEVFQDYAYYYNAFYQDKDYKMEAGQIDILLKKYGNKIKNVMNYITSLHFLLYKKDLNFIYLRYITMQKWFCQHFGRVCRGIYVGF